MSSPQYGDVYLVNFEPSTGHEYQKIRPAVVIQSDQQLKRSSVVTVMPLTSQTEKKLPEDILVQKNHRNRLYCDSVIKVHWITSFDRFRFTKKVGALEAKELDQIKDYLRMHFGLIS